ncbi:MAG TPA: glycosyltransferase [Isosphaeraceae bacterium]|jgi:rhamnosyltransferase subunit B
MHVLLVPFGSYGDVHPFLGLAQALRARGHRVTFLLNEFFGPLVRRLGFEQVPIGAAALFEEAMRHPDLWHPRRAFGVVAGAALEHARLAVPMIAERFTPGQTVAVGGSLAFSVRLAQETLGIPAATVHLQPGILHSNHETPAYPGFETPGWWPRWLKRAFFDQIFARAVDPHVVPGLNALRAELGLPPVRDAMRTWLHAPRRVLGFFPRWFGPPQPDWPPNVTLVGFPLYDERDTTPLPDDLDAFLAAGTPPIAFTPGSANVQGRPFFEAAVAACARLGRRGLLLTRFPEQLPPDLPAGIRHVAFAPFSLLLPRVAALVHHGGVGTAAQGMAAAVPQLVMPLGHDQYDNAARMRRLGVGLALLPKRFRGPAVASALRALIESPAVAESCRAVAARFAEDPRPMDAASAAIEALAEATPPPA